MSNLQNSPFLAAKATIEIAGHGQKSIETVKNQSVPTTGHSGLALDVNSRYIDP